MVNIFYSKYDIAFNILIVEHFIRRLHTVRHVCVRNTFDVNKIVHICEIKLKMASF